MSTFHCQLFCFCLLILPRKICGCQWRLQQLLCDVDGFLDVGKFGVDGLQGLEDGQGRLGVSGAAEAEPQVVQGHLAVGKGVGGQHGDHAQPVDDGVLFKEILTFLKGSRRFPVVFPPQLAHSLPVMAQKDPPQHRCQGQERQRTGADRVAPVF